MALTVDFAKTFANRAAQAPTQGAAQGSTQEDRPKAKFWANVGYPVPEMFEEDGSPVFVSTPIGIPLDNPAKNKKASGNSLFAQKMAAGEALRQKLLQQCMELAPGETKIIGNGPLYLQLRHAKDEVVPSVDESENPFVVDIAL